MDTMSYGDWWIYAPSEPLEWTWWTFEICEILKLFKFDFMEYIIDVMISSFTWVMFIQLHKHIIHPWMFFMYHLDMTSFHMKGG
jgi:hypothetical protein